MLFLDCALLREIWSRDMELQDLLAVNPAWRDEAAIEASTRLNAGGAEPCKLTNQEGPSLCHRILDSQFLLSEHREKRQMSECMYDIVCIHACSQGSRRPHQFRR